ncbi:cytochrome c-type biogenesis CcmF C-terminal domain-containing protein [Xanthomonas tesorieronis]
MHLHVKPFARWIWLGPALMALGGFVTAGDRRFRRSAEKSRCPLPLPAACRSRLSCSAPCSWR